VVFLHDAGRDFGKVLFSQKGKDDAVQLQFVLIEPSRAALALGKNGSLLEEFRGGFLEISCLGVASPLEEVRRAPYRARRDTNLPRSPSRD
jgi:hypothetical protein